MSDQVLKSAGLQISWSAGSGLPGCAVKNVEPELNMQNLKPWLESCNTCVTCTCILWDFSTLDRSSTSLGSLLKDARRQDPEQM